MTKEEARQKIKGTEDFISKVNLSRANLYGADLSGARTDNLVWFRKDDKRGSKTKN